MPAPGLAHGPPSSQPPPFLVRPARALPGVPQLFVAKLVAPSEHKDPLGLLVRGFDQQVQCRLVGRAEIVVVGKYVGDVEADFPPFLAQFFLYADIGLFYKTHDALF